MINRKKSIGLALLITLFVGIGSPHAVYAKSLIEYADSSIQTKVETEFQQQYAEALTHSSEGFETTGDFSKAELSYGIAVYTLDLATSSLILKGYEFPLMLQNEVVGTVSAAQDHTNLENWQIIDVSSNRELPERVQTATEKAWLGATLQYINEPNFGGFHGFRIHSDTGEIFLDMGRNTSYPVAELYAAASRINAQYAGNSDDTQIRPSLLGSEESIIPAIATTLFGMIAIIALLKLKKLKT